MYVETIGTISIVPDGFGGFTYNGINLNAVHNGPGDFDISCHLLPEIGNMMDAGEITGAFTVPGNNVIAASINGNSNSVRIIYFNAAGIATDPNGICTLTLFRNKN